MDDYTLYLDESTTHTDNKNDDLFCMAGIIIKDSDYNIIQFELNKLKKIIWADVPDCQSYKINGFNVCI